MNEQTTTTNTPRPGDIPGSRDRGVSKINTDHLPNVSSDIFKLLTERGKTHGNFTEHARITQNLKAMMMGEPTYMSLTAPMRESLEMIAHKIGRILAGDPDLRDHWDDIAGYAKLVAERCSK